ncbi:NFACT family protein [candidate division WOR-3 bacterium]|nr:NFACT family protein [candidate division WOR-3 bacterium]
MKPYFDNILLYCIIKEFKSLIGEKLKGIKKDEVNNLYLIFQNTCLFASTHPLFYRVLSAPEKKNRNLKNHHFENYVKSFRIIDVHQLGFDRIFYIHFLKKENDSEYYLLFELMGPSSNILLLDREKKIIHQHKKAGKNRIGELYSLSGLSIDEINGYSSEKVFQDVINSKKPYSVIEKNFRKLPLWLEELMRIANTQDLKESFSQIIKNPKPYIYYKNKKPLFISPHKISDKAKRRKSFSAAVSELYDFEIREVTIVNIRKKIERQIKSEEKTLKKLKEDLEKSKLSEVFKMKGELILFYLQDIKKGEKILKLTDPYNESNKIEIEVEPSKTPVRNAEIYFKKYRKAKRSRKVVERRIRNINMKIENYKKLHVGIDNLREDELKKLNETFKQQKFIKEKTKPEERKFRKFLTSGGKTVLVGRNKNENEELTFRVAKPKDLFFHIREAPGSHTILVNDGKLSKDDILDAAQIAAYYSKAKHSTIVPVSYTERRYVRKSKKLGPGKVLLTNEKTIFVEPENPKKKELILMQNKP